MITADKVFRFESALQNDKLLIRALPKMNKEKQPLTIERLHMAARDFCVAESQIGFSELIGITDGKAVGTFVEHRLKNYLSNRFDVVLGNSATGIDLPAPEINKDIKVTSYRRPQSSCPYKNSRQKYLALDIICLY